MDDPTRITPELREELVAYLDGELDDVATVEVERSLSESAEVREEVESLSRTWDLLDELPAVQSSSQFTQRTMASLPAAETAEATQSLVGTDTQRKLTLAALTAGLLVCAAMGFSVANKLPTQTDPLLRDLPVVENLELYQDVSDVTLLEELGKRDPLLMEFSSSSAEVMNDVD